MGAVLSLDNTGLRLPFASATFGRRPLQPRDWTLSNVGQPLSRGRDTRTLARSLYFSHSR